MYIVVVCSFTLHLQRESSELFLRLRCGYLSTNNKIKTTNIRNFGNKTFPCFWLLFFHQFKSRLDRYQVYTVLVYCVSQSLSTIFGSKIIFYASELRKMK